jgi:hypothetical protein
MLSHQFIGGKHFFECYELSQRVQILVNASCTCEASNWTKGVICHHLKDCLKYLTFKPEERLKVNFGDVQSFLRNATLSLVSQSNRVVNVLRFSDGESVMHRKVKEKICGGLMLLGFDFICEAKISKKGVNRRVDVLVLDLGLVVEIGVSEKDESLESKRKDFERLGLKFKIVRC